MKRLCQTARIAGNFAKIRPLRPIVMACAFVWLGLAPCAQALAAATELEQTAGASPRLASPATALLSPQGGRLEVEERLVPQEKGASAARTLFIALPQGASNLQLDVPGQTIACWSTRPAELAESGVLARARQELADERMNLQARLAAVKATLALWRAQPENANAEELARRGKLIAGNVPELALEQEKLQAKIKLVEKRIKLLPASSGVGELVEITLQKPVQAGEKLLVRYSYSWPHCGWNAVYDFNARPGEGSGVIDVSLMADVWQYSGIDWRNTKVTLTTRGSGPREPAPLQEWLVDSPAAPQPRAMPLALNAVRGVKMMSEGPEDALAASATANTDSVYASWTLAQTGLIEGRSRLKIKTDAWKAPLQWLARPSKNDGRVWLLAQYELDGNAVWPEGMAEYSVDGQGVGSGLFSPGPGMATLYFGADPRVNVQTFDVARKKGESGLIRTSTSWTWAWTYTVSNGHARAIKVRLERPEPIAVNDAVSISYKDEPPAQKNQEEHMLFWNVEVPAHGKANVKHSVTINSPQKLQLSPDVP